MSQTEPPIKSLTPTPVPAPPSPANERMQIMVQAIIGLAIVTLVAIKFPVVARSAAAFIITLGILVFVHEWGHFQFARWAGMKINRFALGFPPFIFNREKDGITYSIGALPIGGMVDIAGLGSEEEMVGTATAGTAPGYQRDTSRPFGQKQFQDAGLGRRFSVLFAGPLMNFLFAIVAFVAVYSIAGVPTADFKSSIQEIVPDSPASKANLKSGDEITAVDGKATPSFEKVTGIIRSGKAKPTTLTVMRGKQTLQVPITPVMRDIEGNGVKVPSVGIIFDANAIRSFAYRKVDPLTAVKIGVSDSALISMQILDTIKRAASRKLSKAEKEGIGGPVKIAQAVGQASEYGWPIALRFAAMLSVNLGLMNLLPLPALDGGRILFLGYELVMRRPFDSRKEGIVHAAGMVLLLAFMLFITWRDVASFLPK